MISIQQRSKPPGALALVMIVTITSGKEGTGKTTVAAGLTEVLASRLGAGLNVVDLDVEVPNLTLFLKPEMEAAEGVHLLVPKVDESRCNPCRACAEACQLQAITWDQRLLGQISLGRIGPSHFFGAA